MNDNLTTYIVHYRYNPHESYIYLNGENAAAVARKFAGINTITDDFGWMDRPVIDHIEDTTTGAMYAPDGTQVTRYRPHDATTTGAMYAPDDTLVTRYDPHDVPQFEYADRDAARAYIARNNASGVPALLFRSWCSAYTRVYMNIPTNLDMEVIERTYPHIFPVSVHYRMNSEGNGAYFKPQSRILVFDYQGLHEYEKRDINSLEAVKMALAEPGANILIEELAQNTAQGTTWFKVRVVAGGRVIDIDKHLSRIWDWKWKPAPQYHAENPAYRSDAGLIAPAGMYDFTLIERIRALVPEWQGVWLL